ncbi:MAG: peptidoglycan-binding domain-containing protein, partial [Candidatus Omnitrophota bacterium]
MVLKRGIYVIIALSVILLNGCATARPPQFDEGLRNQISVLEAQVQSKDEEISSLRESLSSAEEAKTAIERASAVEKNIPEAKFRPSVKQIQTALKNAGLNPGKIDGKMGKQTRDAIRAFQKANNLGIDGKVGRKTWG